MSGKIVNLRTFRKRKERATRDAEASENRAKFGRTRTERHFEETRRDAADREYDGRRLPPRDGGSEPD